jgi:phage terminase Nu1 subunit (DNA packaging protein)
MMKTEVTSRELAKLLGLTSSRITDLRKRKIIIPGNKRGTYILQESIRNYVEHLRGLPAEPESAATFKQPIERKTPVAAQADLAKATVERMQADTVLTSGLEKPDSQERFRPSVRKRVRSFRIYLREGRFYTVWDK